MRQICDHDDACSHTQTIEQDEWRTTERIAKASSQTLTRVRMLRQHIKRGADVCGQLTWPLAACFPAFDFACDRSFDPRRHSNREPSLASRGSGRAHWP